MVTTKDIAITLISLGMVSATGTEFHLDSAGRLMYGNGYVCDDYFTQAAAEMICAEMGRPGTATWGDISLPGNSRDYSMDNLQCPAGATRLDQCAHITTHNCFNSEGVLLTCGGTGFALDSDNRLMYNDGYVCDDHFNDAAGIVACNEMGMAFVEWGDVSLPGSSRQFTMDDLQCPTGATRLSQCTRTSNHNCYNSEGVRLSCRAAKFDIGTCDHLQVTDGGNCVGTRVYGNNHDCRITVLGDFTLEARTWSVESHSTCAWDYLQTPNGQKYCTNSPNGVSVTSGQTMNWHTDYSVTRGGWKICAAGAPKFDIGTCANLQVTDNGNCVGTRTYANNDDCRITALEDMTLEVRSWAVETHSQCRWDFLRVETQKYCTSQPNGVRVSAGHTMDWHTDSSVTRAGWKICARQQECTVAASGCWNIRDRNQCLRSQDGRSGYLGQACAWCPDGQCTGNNNNVCEPQGWLEQRPNRLSRIETGCSSSMGRRLELDAPVEDAKLEDAKLRKLVAKAPVPDMKA